MVRQNSRPEPDNLDAQEFSSEFSDWCTTSSPDQPVILAEWSASHFAHIYVRFRPHLVSYGRKFLHNADQIEEVVQDAFLYLMVTLPELDSELGVLRFLKWKVRLLCFDVLRSNARAALVYSQDDFVDLASHVDVTEDLERADDAALVSLALAKLQPRQREALIATIYEEKSIEEAARQMDLNQNAFRQLLFRARTSFKNALVGEAETNGLQVSQILSLAAKKAASNSSKIAVLIGVLLLPWGLVYSPETDSQLSYSSQSPQPSPAQLPADESSAISSGQEGIESGDRSTTTARAETLREDMQPQDSEPPAPLGMSDSNQQVREVISPSPVKDSTKVQVEMAASNWAKSFLEGITNQEPKTSKLEMGSQVVVALGEHSEISLWLTPEQNQPVSSALLFGKGQYAGLVAVPAGSYFNIHESETGLSYLTIVLTGFAIGDIDGKFNFALVENAHFSEIGIEIVLDLSNLESVEGVVPDVRFIPRTQA